MTAFELVKEVIKTLDGRKAINVQAMQVEDVTTIADYFVIASGSSSTQVRSLAEEVEYKLSQVGVEPKHIESDRSKWILLDYGTVIVHIFLEETREFYSLERLWSDAKELDIKELLDSDEGNGDNR